MRFFSHRSSRPFFFFFQTNLQRPTPEKYMSTRTKHRSDATRACLCKRKKNTLKTYTRRRKMQTQRRILCFFFFFGLRSATLEWVFLFVFFFINDFSWRGDTRRNLENRNGIFVFEENFEFWIIFQNQSTSKNFLETTSALEREHNLKLMKLLSH